MYHMKFLFLFFSLTPFIQHSSSSSQHYNLTQGSSLSIQNNLTSPNGIFTAGFYQIGDNAYSFAIWFTKPLFDGNLTVVWMANRDAPVNGRYTRLRLLNSGDMVLLDANQINVWSSQTTSTSDVHLHLHDTGNLVLYDRWGRSIWQSFDSPTNTLLPQQEFNRNSRLRSSRSRTNYSSGYYNFYYDNDNILRLIYSSNITSIYWPHPWLTTSGAGRNTFNDRRVATLDLNGRFNSSDAYTFQTADYGVGPQRRMTLDHDGNLRVYSLDEQHKTWNVTFEVESEPCKIHGICGANGICRYSPSPKCSCLPGYRIKNPMDWTEGCVPNFKPSCRNDSDYWSFVKVSFSEYYGYDAPIGYIQNITLEECEAVCLENCNCKGFQYNYESNTGFHSCYPKIMLYNGYQSINFHNSMYIRIPKYSLSSNGELPIHQELNLECTSNVVQLNRVYRRTHMQSWFKALLWFTGILGGFEILCLLIYFYKTRPSRSSSHAYLQVASGFKRFTYDELKKASRNFKEEIGRGGSAVVYKGKLLDDQTIAIKCLNVAHQGEAEFLAEVSSMGRLNHANLTAQLGYCVEGKHRILVYEFLEHGSLAENLRLNVLDWRKIYNIALGTAKGLAYLHEECLEWVLHCDVKPENILLDATHQPKVSDFGLSKLVNRDGVSEPNVSKIRGTRGYMAPEWLSHLPITSKVDVYSYGIVLLEMVTGRNPIGSYSGEDDSNVEHRGLVSWVRKTMNEESNESMSWDVKIMDPRMGKYYDVDKLENLVKVALLCTQENKDDRPSMRQVVDILSQDKYDSVSENTNE